MSKFTPGPWLIADDTFVYALNDTGSNRVWMSVSSGFVTKTDRTPHEELAATARLISAAPDMANYIKRKADDGDEEAMELWRKINGG